MPGVVIATPADLPAWRRFAQGVEPLFGPMVGQPAFEAAAARYSACPCTMMRVALARPAPLTLPRHPGLSADTSGAPTLPLRH